MQRLEEYRREKERVCVSAFCRLLSHFNIARARISVPSLIMQKLLVILIVGCLEISFSLYASAFVAARNCAAEVKFEQTRKEKNGTNVKDG